MSQSNGLMPAEVYTQSVENLIEGVDAAIRTIDQEIAENDPVGLIEVLEASKPLLFMCQQYIDLYNHGGVEDDSDGN